MEAEFFDPQIQFTVYILSSNSGQTPRQGEFSAKFAKTAFAECKIFQISCQQTKFYWNATPKQGQNFQVLAAGRRCKDLS